MYIENPGKVYGCYNCGEIMGEYTVADTGHYQCRHCGEPSVITFETALDTMLKLQQQGYRFQSDYYDEDYPEAEMEVFLEELEDGYEEEDT